MAKAKHARREGGKKSLRKHARPKGGKKTVKTALKVLVKKKTIKKQKALKQKKVISKKKTEKKAEKKQALAKQKRKIILKNKKTKKEIKAVKKIEKKQPAKQAKKIVPEKKPTSRKVPASPVRRGVSSSQRKKIVANPAEPAKKAVKPAKAKKAKNKPIKIPGEFPAEALFKARIKVIGIGGGGGSIVSEIGRSLEKATFVIADTDARALSKRPGIKYLLFGEDQTHGLGTGLNVELAKSAAEAAKEKIISSFKDQDIIIFIASLGGGLGSGATQVFADAAREFGGITFSIFTTPFKFEGKSKQRIALNALKTLRQSLNVSLVIPNEKIFRIIGADTPITQAFSVVNKSLIESLESLIDLIYNPGIINIDFADFRTILRGRGNTAFLNTVEASGKDRATKICENIMQNPLLQNNNIAAEKILFNIAGADNLSMFEVEKISNHIANLNPKSKIIFGISKNLKLKNKIKTTILMTGGSEDDPLKKNQADGAIIEPEKKELSVEKKSQPKPFVKEKKKNIRPEKPKAEKKKSKKPEKNEEIIETPPEPEQNPISFIPVFEASLPTIVEQKKMEITQVSEDVQKNLPAGRQAIRRSGLEIKKAEELQEKKRIAQEKEWEIPAFLRRVKYK